MTSRAPIRVAVYLSAHGAGHTVRCSAVLEALQELHPLRLEVLGPASRGAWPASLAASTATWAEEACDAGVVQSDDVTVDEAATRTKLDQWLAALPAIHERERRRLEGRFDLVVADVPAPAFPPAKQLGIPALGIANFSWDWIYAELGFREAAEASARDYADAGLLLRAKPWAPMAAFPRVEDVGLIARKPAERAAARRSLELGADATVVLLAFQPAMAASTELPPPRPGRLYLAPPAWKPRAPRKDLRVLAATERFEDAIAAADLVVGKPGYGLIGDVEAAGARFLYVPRPGFPENRVLEQHLSARAATASVEAARLRDGSWEEALVALVETEAPPPAETGGAARAALAIARAAGIDCDRRAS